MSFKPVSGIGYANVSIIEITAFPNSILISEDADRAFDMICASLDKMLAEFHNIVTKDKSSLELLWMTESVKNQPFKSIPHAYIVFRNIGTDDAFLKSESDAVVSNICSVLVQSKYEINVCDTDDEKFVNIANGVNCNTHFSIVKQERIVVGPYSGEWYYGWDTFNFCSRDTLSSFINTMSQTEGTALSVQIIPTLFTQNEQALISNLTNAFRSTSDYNDINCGRVFKSYQFVSERLEKPAFYYGISVFGNNEDCKAIATKIVSLIQSGGEKISDCKPMALDISRENIKITSQFYLYPWLINSALINKYRQPALNQFPIILALKRMPYLITAEELLSFYRLPLFDKSMTSLKEKRGTGEAEQFSSDIIGDNTIKIGDLVTGNKSEVSIGVPFKSWTQHALVVGMPGTGKTTFAVNILTQFARKNIPFLAIEPTKAEYRAMIDAIDGLQIFTPGNNKVSPFIINPFIPPVGITIEQYIPSLLSAFKAAFAMDGPLEMIFLKAVNACYIEYGWKMDSKYGDPGTTVFGMFEYILCFKKIMKTMKYGKEVQGNIETAGLLRLMNLIEQNANIYDTVNTIPIEDLLSRPTVLELNSIENEEQKALIMALLLSSICIYTKINQKGDGKLKNIILIDEAHVLLDAGKDSENGGSSKGTTVKTVQKMIAEIRSYGTGIIIADQKPSKVTDDIVDNTNVKVSFRLTSPRERNLIGESTDMKEADIDYLSHLTVGQAYVFFDKLNTPQLVQTKDTRAADGIRLSVPDKEITERSTYWNTRKEKLIPFRECACSDQCWGCSFSVRNDAEYFASKLINKCSNNLDSKTALMSYAAKIPSVMQNRSKQYSENDFRKLCNCVVIRFLRKAELTTPYTLTLKDISEVFRFAERN